MTNYRLVRAIARPEVLLLITDHPTDKDSYITVRYDGRQAPLVSQCRRRTVEKSYELVPYQEAPKHLIEFCKELRARVHKKTDGWLVISPDGAAAFMTFFEGLIYRFTGKVPPKALRRVGYEGAI